MVMKSIVTKCSYRLVGEHLKEWCDEPDLTSVFDILAKVFSGQVECLTLYTGDGQSMLFLGKSGLAHICLFVSDVEEYIFDNGTGDSTKVDVAGDYWPSFQLCRDQHRAEEIAKEFYVNGLPLSDQKWVHFVEGDE